MMKLVPETCMSVSPCVDFLSATSVDFLWKIFDIKLTFLDEHELLLQLSSAKQAPVVNAKVAANTRAVFIW